MPIQFIRLHHFRFDVFFFHLSIYCVSMDLELRLVAIELLLLLLLIVLFIVNFDLFCLCAVWYACVC